MPENRKPRLWFWRMTVGFLVFHVMRHFPALASWLPHNKPRLKPLRGHTLMSPKPGAKQSLPAFKSLEKPADACRSSCC